MIQTFQSTNTHTVAKWVHVCLFSNCCAQSLGVSGAQEQIWCTKALVECSNPNKAISLTNDRRIFFQDFGYVVVTQHLKVRLWINCFFRLCSDSRAVYHSWSDGLIWPCNVLLAEMLIIVSRVHHFFLSDESISGTELGASRTYVQIREQGMQVWPCMLPNSGVRVRGWISRMDILGHQKLSAKVLPEVSVHAQFTAYHQAWLYTTPATSWVLKQLEILRWADECCLVQQADSQLTAYRLSATFP